MTRSRSVRRGILSAATAVLALAGLLGLAGCAGDDGATPRSVVQLVGLNDNLPLPSDVYNLGSDLEKPDDDFIPIDYVTVRISSRPSDPALTMEPRSSFGTVRFDHYTLDFADNDLDDDGADDIEDLAGPMNLVVPINSEAEGAVLAVMGGWKGRSPLADLRMGGEYLTTASFTFFGLEETSRTPIQLEGGLLVSFADYADKR